MILDNILQRLDIQLGIRGLKHLKGKGSVHIGLSLHFKETTTSWAWTWCYTCSSCCYCDGRPVCCCSARCMVCCQCARCWVSSILSGSFVGSHYIQLDLLSYCFHGSLHSLAGVVPFCTPVLSNTFRINLVWNLITC